MSKVKGLNELIAVLEKIPDSLDVEVERVVRDNAQEIETEAKIIVPRDKGILANSIKAFKSGDKEYTIKANATGVAPYAAYIEYGEPVGTGPNGGPRPYLFPSFFKQRPLFIAELEDILETQVKKA